MQSLRIDIPSDPVRLAPTRKAIEHFARSAGLGAAAVDEIGLVVNEALANVIRHAYDGKTDRPISIGVDCKDAAVKITIRDWGNGVVPKVEPKKDRPDTPGGLGMVCLKHMADNVEFTKQPDGMLLTITKKLQTGRDHG